MNLHARQLNLPLAITRDVPVTVRCPSCGESWLAAILTPGAWWMDGCTPLRIAKQVYCRSCAQAPPMEIAA